MALGLPFAAGDEPDPGDEILAEARDAASHHDFSGHLSIQWYDGSSYHSEEMPVRSVDGVVEILGTRTVVSDESGRYVLDDDEWQTLWSESDIPDAPAPSEKYDLSIATTAVAGRETQVVEVSSTGTHVLRERRFIDEDTGILLRREQFDDQGRAVRVVSIRSVDDIADGASPEHPDDSPVTDAQVAPDGHLPAPDTVGDGWALQGSYTLTDGTVQRYYSDGVFGLSVFQRAGTVDWEHLPAGSDETEFDGHDARLWIGPSGTVAVWEMDDTVYTVVTDAPGSELDAVVDDFENPPALFGRVVRFVISPFSLF